MVSYFPVILIVLLYSTNPDINLAGDTTGRLKKKFTNPVADGADPWFTEQDGYYYYCFASGKSISISRSRFLTKPGEIGRASWRGRV